MAVTPGYAIGNDTGVEGTSDAGIGAHAQSKTGIAMPAGRPPLAEESEEFLLVERWVADGCPDDTV